MIYMFLCLTKNHKNNVQNYIPFSSYNLILELTLGQILKLINLWNIIKF